MKILFPKKPYESPDAEFMLLTSVSDLMETSPGKAGDVIIINDEEW